MATTQTSKTTRKVRVTKATAAKAVVKPTKQAAEKAAPKPKVNEHVAAGVDFAKYSGTSKTANGNRKVKIMLRPYEKDLSERMQKTLYSLREKYGDKPFIARGLDNGVLRDLAGAGLILLHGGQKQSIDGHDYMTDGATPVTVKLSAAGNRYGKT
jgi:hypothetical protein